MATSPGSARGPRHLLVWLHVLTSVGWLSMALVLVTLLTVGLTGNGGSLVAATSMAHLVDGVLLAPLANASAFTGFVLAAATPWGFFRHWWVLAKFAVTVVQLSAGIFVLSPALTSTERAAASGQEPPLALVVGTALMVGAIAFQAWLSVAKPWRRTPWSSARKLPTARGRVFTAAVFAPLADIALGIALGFPAPLFEVVVLVVVLSGRPRRLRDYLPSAGASKASGMPLSSRSTDSS